MHRVGSDKPFFAVLLIISGLYVLLLISMLAANAAFIISGSGTPTISPEWSSEHPIAALFIDNPIGAALADPNIQYSIYLSLISCTITTILSLWVAVPVGYL